MELPENAIPESNIATVVARDLRANVNSTKHLMSEFGWVKRKVKWGGVDYSRALWTRPGCIVEGGKVFDQDGKSEDLTDHLAALNREETLL